MSVTINRQFLFIAVIFLLSGCSGHVAPVIPITMPRQIVRPIEPTPEVVRLRNNLQQQELRPIFLFLEPKDQGVNSMANQSGIEKKIPDTFRIMAMSVASSFGSSVKVITSRSIFIAMLNDPKIRDFCFEVEGAISAFDVSSNVISTSIRSGFEIGSSDEDGKYRNTDKNGRLMLDILFKQYGKVFLAANGELSIQSVNRGYAIGLRIDDSGLGIDSYHTVEQGIGTSLRKLVSFVFADGIKRIMAIKNPQAFYSGWNHNGESFPAIRSSRQGRKVNPYNTTHFTADIRREEEAFLEGLRKYSNP